MGIEAPELNDFTEDEKEGCVGSIGKFVEKCVECVKPMIEDLEKKRHPQSVLVSQFDKCIRSIKKKEWDSENVFCL